MKYYCDKKRHLICVPYSISNLHKMAHQLEINTCWYHPGKYPHYDIPKRRYDEIRAKCIFIPERELYKMIKESL